MFIKPTLAKNYDGKIHLPDYLSSEKLDGVRAIWDTDTLYTRNGNEIFAPGWFTRALPRGIMLDGELYIGRGKFEQLSGTVRKHSPIDEEWRNVKYLVFDSPSVHQNFYERLAAIQNEFEQCPYVDWDIVQLVDQFKLNTDKELDVKLDEIVLVGGEGIILREIAALYESGRSESLLKVKPVQDAEAIVLGYKEGKGRNEGRLGSLYCRKIDEHIHFNCSGMSDAVRDNPPPVGSVITYQFSGWTRYGRPRHPRFLRVRND